MSSQDASSSGSSTQGRDEDLHKQDPNDNKPETNSSIPSTPPPQPQREAVVVAAGPVTNNGNKLNDSDSREYPKSNATGTVDGDCNDDNNNNNVHDDDDDDHDREKLEQQQQQKQREMVVLEAKKIILGAKEFVVLKAEGYLFQPPEPEPRYIDTCHPSVAGRVKTPFEDGHSKRSCWWIGFSQFVEDNNEDDHDNDNDNDNDDDDNDKDDDENDRARREQARKTACCNMCGAAVGMGDSLSPTCLRQHYFRRHRIVYLRLIDPDQPYLFPGTVKGGSTGGKTGGMPAAALTAASASASSFAKVVLDSASASASALGRGGGGGDGSIRRYRKRRYASYASSNGNGCRVKTSAAAATTGTGATDRSGAATAPTSNKKNHNNGYIRFVRRIGEKVKTADIDYVTSGTGKDLVTSLLSAHDKRSIFILPTTEDKDEYKISRDFSFTVEAGNGRKFGREEFKATSIQDILATAAKEITSTTDNERNKVVIINVEFEDISFGDRNAVVADI